MMDDGAQERGRKQHNSASLISRLIPLTDTTPILTTYSVVPVYVATRCYQFTYLSYTRLDTPIEYATCVAARIFFSSRPTNRDTNFNYTFPLTIQN